MRIMRLKKRIHGDIILPRMCCSSRVSVHGTHALQMRHLLPHTMYAGVPCVVIAEHLIPHVPCLCTSSLSCMSSVSAHASGFTCHSQIVWRLTMQSPGQQVEGGIVRVTPALVQAAEAVLRGALEPLATPDEGTEEATAMEASPRKKKAVACAETEANLSKGQRSPA